MHEDGSRTNQEIVSLKLPLGEGVKGGGGVKVSEGFGCKGEGGV